MDKLKSTQQKSLLKTCLLKLTEGFSTMMMEGIVDYSRVDLVAVPKSDAYLVTCRGQQWPRKSTQGWELLVKWKDTFEGHEGISSSRSGRVCKGKGH